MDATEAPLKPAQPVKKPRGCFFYGCLIASGLALLVCLMIGLGLYSAYRYYTGLVAQYTSTTPMPLPHVELAPEAMEDLEKRVDAFKKSGETDDPVPLVLTADEINAKIAQNPDLKGRVHVEIPGDKLHGMLSLPLGNLGLPGLKGRFLNGKATFRVRLANEALSVYLDSLEVNGKPVPNEVLQTFQGKNLAEEFAKDPDNAKEIRKLESIEVRDGKLILKNRKKTQLGKEKSKDSEKAKPSTEKGDAKAEVKDESNDDPDQAKTKSP